MFSLNCTWSGSGSANLSWTVEQQRVEVKEGELLTLDWADLGKKTGDVVFVTCSGESSGNSASNQTGVSSWASVSTVILSYFNIFRAKISVQVSQTLVVPGIEVEEEIDSKESEEDEDEDENGNSDDDEDDD